MGINEGKITVTNSLAEAISAIKNIFGKINGINSTLENSAAKYGNIF